jgi:type IV secretion system protein VirD4
LILLLIGLWAATQWAGGQMNYSPALGGQLHRFDDWTIYAPWALLSWTMSNPPNPPLRSVTVDEALAAFLVYAVLLVFIAAMPWRGRAFKVQAFGTDGWGNWRDMKKAGLLGNRGTVIGIHRGRLLTYDGPEHQIVSGASRSGKGIGHVIPTLLCWPESAIAYDVKGELWGATSGYRSQYQHCVLFNPTRLDSARFNPLLEVRKGPHEIRDVQNLVEMLVNPDGSKRTLDVWDQNASQFLVGLILHVLYSEPFQNKHLGKVRELLLDFDNTCKTMMTTPHRLATHTGQPQVYPEVGRVAKSLLSQAERFRSSVRGTAEGYLALWADEVVCEVTSRSDFAIGDLMCLDKPMTLYLQPPPSDADRMRPLIRLLLNQAARALMEHRETDSRGRRKKRRLLMLLDEFPTLGRLEFFSMNLRQMAGYGIKAQLIVQSFNDIIEYYGPHNTIIDNCHILCCFASADTVTQQRISQMTGEIVEYRASYSRPQAVLAAGRRSISHNEQVRPLLHPGQIRTLSNNEQLIFVTGFKPFRTAKLRYYERAELSKRVLDPPEAAKCALQIGNVSAAGKDWRDQRSKGPPLPLPADLRIGGGEDDAPLVPPHDLSATGGASEDETGGKGGFY